MSSCREAAALVLAAAALSAHAADWTLSGSLGASAERLRNAELAVPSAPHARRLALSGELALRGRSELWDFALDGALTGNFSDEDRYDTTDGSLGLGLARRYERAEARARAAWRRDSTLASELETTGVLLARAQRDSYSAGLSYQRSLGERLSAQAGFSAAAVRYDRAERPANLFDSDTAGVNAGLTYAWSARTTLGLAASDASTDTEPFAYESRTTSLQASASHAWSERLSFSAAYGPAHTRIDSAPLVAVCPAPIEFCLVGLVPFIVQPVAKRTRTTAASYDLSARWLAGPQTTASLSARRGQSPSGAGFLADTDALGARVSHRLREHLELDADAWLTYADVVGAAGTSRTRTERFGAQLSWRVAEHWTVEGGARYARADVPGGARPHAETFFLGVRWRPRERRL